MTRAISLFAVCQLFILGCWLLSFEYFINLEIAFISAFTVMLGSMYSYTRLVRNRLENDRAQEGDLIDKIDDPYDLYDDADGGLNDAVSETDAKNKSVSETENNDNVDIKAVIKEEKKRLRANTGKNVKTAAPAIVSVYRLIPYLLLVVGFIGLNNNQLLSLWPYMVGLAVGIVAGLFAGREMFVPKS